MNGEATGQPIGRISVIDPISRAIDWTTLVLFRPFDLGKWFVLGFCAWLAMLGEGGGPNFSGNWGGGGGRRNYDHGMHDALEWTLTHLIPLILIVSVILVFVIALCVLVTWLSSRGKFMFLDGVVHNRAAVVDPWHRFRKAANSVFLLRLVLGLILFGLILVLLVFVGFLVWIQVDRHDPEPVFIVGLILVALIFLALAFAFGLAGLAINDFMVPIMYLRDCRVGEAWRELRDLLAARPGSFVLYVLVKIVIAIFIAFISVVACCVTCCLVVLPYIGTVILLPLWVFRRSYSVYFLGQFGPQYARFVELGPVDETTPVTSG
jgi:hypothetical protein